MDENVAALAHTLASSLLDSHASHTHSQTLSCDQAAAVVTLLSFTAAASPLCTVVQLSYSPLLSTTTFTRAHKHCKWHPSFNHASLASA